jgi:hypothetical protein
MRLVIYNNIIKNRQKMQKCILSLIIICSIKKIDVFFQDFDAQHFVLVRNLMVVSKLYHLFKMGQYFICWHFLGISGNAQAIEEMHFINAHNFLGVGPEPGGGGNPQ